MKRLWFLALLLGMASVSHAELFRGIEDKSVTVNYQLAFTAAGASTATLIIDLSDTVTWPHTETGYIVVTGIKVEFDKAAASTGTVKLGVVNFVNASTGSVTWFWANTNGANVSNTNNIFALNYYPTPIRLKVVPHSTDPGGSNGTTPYILSNDKTSGSTLYQNDVPLGAPIGAPTPSRGDVVMFIDRGANISNIRVELQYYAER